MNHTRMLRWSALSCAVAATLGSACAPVVTSPITTGSGGETPSVTASSGSVGSGSTGTGTGGGGGMGACGVSAGAVTLASSNQGSVQALAVDATSVYWVTADGSRVMMLTPK